MLMARLGGSSAIKIVLEKQIMLIRWGQKKIVQFEKSLKNSHANDEGFSITQALLAFHL